MSFLGGGSCTTGAGCIVGGGVATRGIAQVVTVIKILVLSGSAIGAQMLQNALNAPAQMASENPPGGGRGGGSGGGDGDQRNGHGTVRRTSPVARCRWYAFEFT